MQIRRSTSEKSKSLKSNHSILARKREVNVMKGIGIFCLCAAMMLLAACSQEQGLASQAEEAFVFNEAEFDAGESQVSEELGVIASLELDNGNVISFIDEQLEGNEPKIGVVELGQPGTNSTLSQFAQENPSPLELYLALTPDKVAPAELTLHHQKLAEVRSEISLEPRKLSSAGLSAQAVDVHNGCNFETGFGNHVDFLGWVTAAFGAALPNHGHGHYLTSTHYGVTGKSSKRALGTCNAGGYVKSVRIEYQFGKNLWINVPLGVTWLFPGQFLFYYSDSGFLVPHRYRIKVGYTVEGNPANIAHTEGSW